MHQANALIRQEGHIENIEISRGKHHLLTNHEIDKWAKTGTALGAALGSWVNPSVANVDMKEWADLFTCSIEEKELRGLFEYADFTNGDKVVAIIQDSYPRAQIIALYRESDRRIWVPPYTDIGSKAYKRKQLKRAVLLTAIVFVLVAGLFYSLLEKPLPALGTGLLIALLASIIYLYYDWKDKGRRTRLADEIFRIFGFESPESIALKASVKYAEDSTDDEDKIRHMYSLPETKIQI